MTDDKQGLAERLSAARTAAGSPTYRRLYDALRDALGNAAPSPQTIHDLHTKGVQPERVDLFLLQFLAELYDVTVADLSPIAAERIKSMRDLLERSKRCIAA